MKMLQKMRADRSALRRRGAALVYATVAAVAMSGLALALLTVNLGTQRVRMETRRTQVAFYAAEAGLSSAYVQLTGGYAVPEEGESVSIGGEESPVMLGNAGGYWAEILPLGSRGYAIRSTGTDGRSRERLELIVSEAPTGFFQYAAFGSEGVDLDSNSFIDSYDSALGTYDSQVQGGNDFARENGHTGSNADIVLGSNTEVHGDATPGPGHVVDDSAPGAYVSGSTEPADEEWPLPEIPVPPVPSLGVLPGSSDAVLGPGAVHYDRIHMQGGTTLKIVGPATLVVDDLLMKANSNLEFDAAAGPIEVYGTGDFVLKSNSTVSTYSDSALDVTLLLSGNNMTETPGDSVELSANSEFIGAIYAPNAFMSLGSNFDIYGSIMCGQLDLSSNGEIHYDEALLYDGWGATGELEVALWHRIGVE